MKIRSFHIEGFGILHDTGVDGLPPGLSVFTGDNESGKSTLNRFVRAALFGTAGRVPKDEPLRGGSHGGSVVLDLEDGNSLVFELKKGKVYVTDRNGEKLAHGKALDLFGGVDRQIYERIFAVGLDDIHHQGDSILDQEKLRNRLFAAGAGLGDVSLSDAFAGIEKEMEKLARNKSSKSKSVIKDDSAKLVETERKLRDLSNEKDEYAGLTERKITLGNERDTIDGELRRLSVRLVELKRILSVLEPYSRLKSVRKEIDVLEEKGGTLPPGASERFSEAGRKIASYMEELRKNEKAVSNAKREADGLHINQGLLDCSSDLESLRDDRNRLAGLESELAFQREKLKNLSSELARQLSRISPDWTEEYLLKADTSLTTGDDALKLGGKFEILEKRRIQVDLLIEKSRQELEATITELSDARVVFSQFADDERGAADISSDMETVKKAKAVLSETNHIRDNILVLENYLNEYESRLASIDLKAGSLRPLCRKKLLFLPIVAVFGGAAAIWYVFGRNSSFVFLAGSLAVSLISLAILKWHGNRDAMMMKELLNEKKQILGRMDQVRHDLSIQEGNMDSLKNGLIRSLGTVGFSHEPDMDELDRWLADAALDLARAEDMERASSNVNEIHGKFRKQSDILSSLEEERSDLGKALDNWWEGWRTFLSGKGLPESVKPATFQLVMQSIISAEKLLSSKREVCDKIAKLEEDAETAERRVTRIMDRSGITSCGTVAENISCLTEHLAESRDAISRKLILERKLEDLMFEKEELEKTKKAACLERLDLMSRANASTEEMFFSRVEDHARLHELRSLEMELLARIEGLTGSQVPVERIFEDLDHIDTLSLNLEMKENLEHTEALSARREEIIATLAKDEMRLQEVSYEETRNRLLQEKENLLFRCRENAERWAVCAVCKRLLEETRNRYELQKQPGVVKMASRYMQTITGGRYSLVTSAVDRRIYLSENRTQLHKDSRQWSSGLADQAYIAIRLAVSANFSGSAGLMPIVLDDIHLRFDPLRQRNLAKVLLRHSVEQQILFFSCDPGFAEILLSEERASGTESGIYRIEDGRIREIRTGDF